MPIESAKIKTSRDGRETSIVHEKKNFSHYLGVGRRSTVDSEGRKESASWILVTYDVSANNMRRNAIREKIKRYGGLWKNDSTYLVPKSVRSVAEIKNWGKFSDVNLYVIGIHVDDKLEVKTLTQAYIGKLLDDLKEIRESAKKSFDVLKIIEENTNLSEEELKDKFNVSFRGFHNVVNSAKNRSNELVEMVNNYGNTGDVFETELLYTFIDKLEERFERIKEAKGLNK